MGGTGPETNRKDDIENGNLYELSGCYILRPQDVWQTQVGGKTGKDLDVNGRERFTN